VINITDLDFSYGEGGFRLRVPSFEVARGETVAVIGPSGTGKTTLLNLVSGIAVPASGSIVVDGTAVTQMGDAARRSWRISTIGLVFQEFELLSYLGVLDNILLPCRINAALKLDGATRERAARLAADVGIADKLDRKVDKLSQGERQRVAVCRALLTEPDLILADEPTGNLDPRNKGRVLDILFDYVQVHGTTLVTVTHDHDLLPRFDRVVEFGDFHDDGNGGGGSEGDRGNSSGDRSPGEGAAS